MFKSYVSIENSYRKKHIQKALKKFPELKAAEFLIQEKIHGANIQLIFVEDGTFKVATRKRILHTPEEIKKFYGLDTVLENMEDCIEFFKKTAADGKYRLRLFGELFGGNIQKGVDYGKEKRIMFFDATLKGKFLDPHLFMNSIAKAWENLIVPNYGIVNGLDEALSFEVDDLKSLVSKSLGIDCIAEGIVIKPYRKVYIPGQSIFYLKKKSEKFLEVSRHKDKPKEALPEEVQKARELFLTYLNEARVETAMSKLGPIEDASDIGKYLKEIITDAREDFMKDREEDFSQQFDKKELKTIFNGAKYVVPMLQKYLYEISVKFNNPIISSPLENSVLKDTKIPLESSFLSIFPENIILSALKLNEWDKTNDIIIRFKEICGFSTETRIKFSETFSQKIKSIISTDLIEREEKRAFQWDSNKRELVFSMGKYELCTFKLEIS